jgi:hypothetical protein
MLLCCAAAFLRCCFAALLLCCAAAVLHRSYRHVDEPAGPCALFLRKFVFAFITDGLPPCVSSLMVCSLGFITDGLPPCVSSLMVCPLQGPSAGNKNQWSSLCQIGNAGRVLEIKINGPFCFRLVMWAECWKSKSMVHLFSDW